MGATAFAATTVNNGSFETGTNPGLFITLPSGDSTDIPGWTVTAGNIDYVGSYWTAQDGSRSLDMNGVVPGAISQSLTTVTGHTYAVNFYMAGNPDGALYGSPAVKTMNVDTGSTPTSYSFDTTGHTDANMGWAPETYNFTASGTATPLTFTSTTTGSQPATWFGPTLDNVSVTDVPTNPDQCKNDGWKAYTSPTFKNQGDCVSYIQSNPNALGNKNK
jgi:choice-of-anchor C domain-containing protein